MGTKALKKQLKVLAINSLCQAGQG